MIAPGGIVRPPNNSAAGSVSFPKSVVFNSRILEVSDPFTTCKNMLSEFDPIELYNAINASILEMIQNLQPNY